MEARTAQLALRIPRPMSEDERAFREFHAENPQVMERLEELCCELVACGYSHYGVKSLIEIVRYERAVTSGAKVQTTEGEQRVKLNNNFAPWYARELARKRPEFASLFRFRRSRADDAYG